MVHFDLLEMEERFLSKDRRIQKKLVVDILSSGLGKKIEKKLRKSKEVDFDEGVFSVSVGEILGGGGEGLTSLVRIGEKIGERIPKVEMALKLNMFPHEEIGKGEARRLGEVVRHKYSHVVTIYDYGRYLINGEGDSIYYVLMECLERLSFGERRVLNRDIEEFDRSMDVLGKLTKERRLGGKYGGVRTQFWEGMWSMMEGGLGYCDLVDCNVMKNNLGEWRLVDLESALYRL